MFFAGPITYWVAIGAGVLTLIAGLYAVVDAAIRRPDAYLAAGKNSKMMWLLVLAACLLVMVLGVWPIGRPALAPITLLWLAALVGVMVYLVDVRPALRDVVNGSRW